MNKTLCYLCKTATTSTFCIDHEFSKCSNLSLRAILENLLDRKMTLNQKLQVCSVCVDLLNDLDTAENTYKKVRLKVLSYFDVRLKEPNLGKNVEQDLLNIKVFKNEEDPLNYELYPKSTNEEYGTNELNALTQQHNVPDKVNLLEDSINESKKENLVNCSVDIQIVDCNSEERISECKKDYQNNSKPFTCNHCGKTWKTLGRLKTHLFSHNTIKPFICEVCGQAYKHKYALDVHVGMHSGINPFVCNYCNKSFTQKGALQRHLPIHTGETPYQCDLCGKRFVHHTSFNIHQLSHSGQRDYKCPECGLAFLSGSHLKRHTRVHSGERNFVCNVCGKSFAERYNLVSHQKLHESALKEIHKCHLCGIAYTRKLKLEEHMVKNHQKISDRNDSLVQNLFLNSDCSAVKTE